MGSSWPIAGEKRCARIRRVTVATACLDRNGAAALLGFPSSAAIVAGAGAVQCGLFVAASWAALHVRSMIHEENLLTWVPAEICTNQTNSLKLRSPGAKRGPALAAHSVGFHMPLLLLLHRSTKCLHAATLRQPQVFQLYLAAVHDLEPAADPAAPGLETMRVCWRVGGLVVSEWLVH